MKAVGDDRAASGSSCFGVNSIYLGWQNDCISNMQNSTKLDVCISGEVFSQQQIVR